MLRKKTSFKPNLKQVAATPQQQASQTQSSTTAPPAPQASAVNQAPKDGSPPPKNPNSECAKGKDEGPDIPEMSIERVQEAITQLTGQKFEPLKSLSLRSSANKNVKLKDLLFFNPPMTKDQKRHKKNVCLAKKTASEQQKKSPTSEIEPQVEPTVIEKTSNTNSDNNGDMDSDTTSTAEEHSLVPKVKMGPEGQLILDESSTIINRKNIIKEQEAIVEDNEDIISRTNYDSFRRRPTNTSQTKWSLEDTKKFYHALTILGTDFSMMESLLFSGLRSRTELHKKFKREERVNKLKIDIALSNRISLNSEELEDLREIFYKQ